MGVRQYNPTSAGRRGGSVSDFSDLTHGKKNRPEKSLLRPKRLLLTRAALEALRKPRASGEA